MLSEQGGCYPFMLSCLVIRWQTKREDIIITKSTRFQIAVPKEKLYFGVTLALSIPALSKA